MKITVVTVNYNNKIGLERTIKSVSEQDYPDKQFLIIDGGSNDGSLDVILSHESAIDYYCSEKDNGVFHAMNKSLDKASGEYIIFMNSGDIFHESDSLRALAAGAAQKPDFVYGDIFFEDENGKRTRQNFPDNLSFSFLFKKFLPHQATLTRSQLLKEKGGYDLSYKITADSVFIKREIALFGASYIHVDAVIAVCELGGLSTDDERFGELRRSEKQRFWDSDFALFKDDYIRLFELEQELSKKQEVSFLQKIRKKLLG